MSSSWILLIIAGLLEVAWTLGLKYTQGFTRPLPSVLTASAIIASMGLLSLAVKQLPIGTAYAVWVGIGAAGAAVAGMVLFQEPATPARLFFLTLMIVAIIGLKVTSGTH
ncbi:quaternary ammonium compound efflux SMR transporter SugE [Corallococcus sp. RDP092CA]|uniref:quaternary ammonium compound efflux SMR transporter SugE n=1 Tax=Corallococcus sp. RDP092CA TaxID=3109369 RepID=UPI0035AF0F99